jgi:hypothetical protein
MKSVKCKKCSTSIKPHANDIVECECKSISVQGTSIVIARGLEYDCFTLVGDDGIESDPAITPVEDRPLTREQKLDLLADMIRSYDNLPASAMIAPVTHYDFCSLLVLLSSLFKD